MKIKLPKQKAIRSSTGSKILKQAKKIALKNYSSFEISNKIKKISKNIYKKIHLVETADLNAKEIKFILDEAKKFINFNKRRVKKSNLLEGRTIFNLFFEDSTRTRTSFEVAAKRLGADLINVAVKDSSINKGETLLDTMTTINSMNPDVLIVRHPEEGISKRISNNVDACVINAGDGSHEHPTQALLDALTIKNRFNNFSKLQIAICGDILHSRVARSNIIILSKLGAKINVIGPKQWLPKNINKLPVEVYTDMKKGLRNCDIVMMLRIQKERIVGKIMPNQKTYFNKYGLDYNKLKYAKKNAFVMHPGPMNRGVEIDSKLADDITRSLIQEQVAMGVAIRMACLDILIKNRDNVVSY
ncbi:MAG: aspartate carbamoyltransferase catalytic subunit [Alphaproteobacteria bacterium]|nr:aspartate carbamoyltransferase catalytic subunit [Alphaproteobacteria bacterium]